MRRARTLWKDLDPIGRRVRPRFDDATPWATVVGVAKDVKQGGVDRATGTELYLLLEQLPQVFPAPHPAGHQVVSRWPRAVLCRAVADGTPLAVPGWMTRPEAAYAEVVGAVRLPIPVLRELQRVAVAGLHFTAPR